MSRGSENALEVASDAVRQAAQVCRRVQASLVAGDSRRKADRSPVTIADFASQALICASLQGAFPDEPVVGEESAAALRDDASLRERVVGLVSVARGENVPEEQVLAWIDRGTVERPKSGRFWTLDPIDGTKGFLRGQQYAVALARLDGAEVEIGLLACPNLNPTGGGSGLLLEAARGRGATSRSLDSGAEPRPISVRALSDPTQARLCESVEPSHSNQAAIGSIARRLGIEAESLRIDSQAKYAVVARGDADVYVRLPADVTWQEWIWDHAAGVLLVEEAGGTVTDALGRPLDFSSGRSLRNCRGIAAAPRGIHAAVVEATRQELDERDS